MKPIATLVFGVCVFWLFRLVRDPNVRMSKALWIPVLWLFIAGSRPVSMWFNDVSNASDATADASSSYYSGSPLEASVFEGLEAAGLIILIRRKPRVVAVLKRNWPIAVYFGYCLLSASWSSFTYVSVKRWTKLGGDLVMVLVMLTDHEPRAAVQRVMTRTGFFLIPLSVLFIEAYPELGTSPGSLMTAPVLTGVTMGKNELGQICVIWGLAFMWCLLDAFRHKRHSSLFAYAVVYAVAFWLVEISNSATSLTCLLLGSVLMVITNLRWVARRRWLVHCLAVGVVSGAAVAIFYLPSLLSNVGRNSTLTGRTELWQYVFPMVSNRWIGTGYQSFWLGWRLEHMWQVYWWHPIESHEGYIEVYVNLGWIGIALLSAMVLRGYSKVVDGIRRGMEMGTLKLAYIAAALIANLSESLFQSVMPAWIALLIGVTAIPPILNSNDRPPLPTDHVGEEDEDDREQLWFNPLPGRDSQVEVPYR
jgi:exopolysaccharide production protein ExoQ